MKANRFLKAAVALWVLTVLTGSVTAGAGTIAKYTASAAANASARVAKWWPFESYHEKDTTDDDESGAPVLLVFDKTNPQAQTATLYLNNRSEVTACYVLEATVEEVEGETGGDAPEVVAFLADIMASIADSHADYDPVDGIVVGYGATEELSVTIPVKNFTGLEITARSVQVD